MIRRPPRSTLSSSSAASDVYKRQLFNDALELLRGHLIQVAQFRQIGQGHRLGIGIIRRLRGLTACCFALLPGSELPAEARVADLLESPLQLFLLQLVQRSL